MTQMIWGYPYFRKPSFIAGWWFQIQLGMSSSQLTSIFFRGVETTNQILMTIHHIYQSNNEFHGIIRPYLLLESSLLLHPLTIHHIFDTHILCYPFVIYTNLNQKLHVHWMLVVNSPPAMLGSLDFITVAIDVNLDVNLDVNWF